MSRTSPPSYGLEEADEMDDTENDTGGGAMGSLA